MTDDEKEIAELKQSVRGLTILIAELTGRLVQHDSITSANAWWAVNQAAPRIGKDPDLLQTWDEVWKRNLPSRS